MADFNNIAINATAAEIERMANMEINNTGLDENSDDSSIPTSKVVHRAIMESGGGGDFVSYVLTQDLTETQKGIARDNIDAVSTTELTGAITAANAKDVSVLPKTFTDDEKVQARNNIGAFDVSKIVTSENYENAPTDSVYDVSAIRQFALANTVTVSPNQTLPDRKKQIGRQNIDVDGGKWELLYTIEGDGDTRLWEYTQTPDGTPIKLSAVAITVTQTVAETANVYGQLYGYYNDTVAGLAAISKILTTGVLDGQATAVIQPNKGYYEAYGVDMAKGNPANMSYSGFRQFLASTADFPYINKIKIVIQNTIKMSVGNKIDVWGVKYYE